MALTLADFQIDPTSNRPIASDTMGTGQVYFIADVIDQIEAVVRQQSLDKAWRSYLGLTSISWSGAIAFSYISATQFSMPGDQTADWRVGTPIKALVSAGTVYGVITDSTFASSITTVTVQMRGSGALDAGLTEVLLGAMTPDSSGDFPDSAVSQNQNPLFAEGVQTPANTYTATPVGPPILAYFDGLIMYFRADTANTGSVLLQIVGLATKNLTLWGSNNLQAGDIKAGSINLVVYDLSGDVWQLLSLPAVST